MTGYRVVFDREKMVLGWKASDCELFPSIVLKLKRKKKFLFNVLCHLDSGFLLFFFSF